MKKLFILVSFSQLLPLAASAADACRIAADTAIAQSRDSDAQFQSIEGNLYIYGVSRGHDSTCYYDVTVRVKRNPNGTCTAGKAFFDSGSANCG